MIIHYKNIHLNNERFSEFNPEKKTIVLLHGFTGSANDWQDSAIRLDKRFNKIAMDLIGHGKTSSPSDLNFYLIESIIEQIEEILNHYDLKEIILCGYSMGGRVAVSFAVSKPNLVTGLILESSSTGIKNKNERAKRKNNDEELASFILNNSIEDFAAKWLDQEIFGTIRRFSNEKIKMIKLEKMKNSRTGLANSLRGFGTGVMPYLGNELIRLKFPVLLITGGLDEKFTQINQSLRKLFPSAKHKIISTAGHNTHLEEPKKFVEAVNKFLKQF
jgi:2-succinyl-6-hydroxy-2,4-cyclohexadiene-1-carboxylate synthase